jgi:hypothetical protein
VTSVSRQVGALLAFLTLVGAASAHAQLRSLVAIKHLALESSPGAERQTKALRAHDTLKNHPGLLVPTLDSVPAGDHPYFARCVVRANLPKPLSVALECYDAAGAYVGTKRAAHVDQLAFEIMKEVTYAPPLSRPLNSYRYIYVEPVYGKYQNVDLLVSLLRKSPFTVIRNHEALAMPAAERDLILRCTLGDTTEHISPTGDLVGAGSAEFSLLVSNMDNDLVGNFGGEARWVLWATTDARLERQLMESAVQKLIRAHKEEFIYARPEKR